MATFVPISYTYVPTAPRSKSTNARRKPTSKQFDILDKNQRIKPSSAAVGTPRLQLTAAVAATAAAADDSKNDTSGVQEISIVHGGNGKEDELDDDDSNLPTIEELRNNILQEKDVVTEDSSSDNTVRGVEEVTPERGRSINRNKSASGNNLNNSPDDPIILLGDNDSSASEAEVEVDHGSLRAESAAANVGLFSGPKNAVDSTTPAPPNGWHDIDDFPEFAPRLRLVEQRASTSNSISPHPLLPCLSSEPLHNSTSIESFHTSRARFEATTSYSAGPQSPPLRCFGASPENQLNQEGHFHTVRGVADEQGLVGPALDIFPINKREREEQEQEDEDNDYERPQQEVNYVAAVGGEADGVFSSSSNSNTTSTAKTNLVFESTPINPQFCQQLFNANQDWEVRQIIGREDVDSILHYLVDWCPTLLPEFSLGYTKKIINKFETRLRGKRQAENGGPQQKR